MSRTENGYFPILLALALFGAFGSAGCNQDVLSMIGDAPNPAIAPLVLMESVPPGAEARVADGSNCRTPCELTVRPMGPFTVEFSLKNYTSRSAEVILQSADTSPDPAGIRLDPNPLSVNLEPLPRSVPAPKGKPARKPQATQSSGARTSSIN